MGRSILLGISAVLLLLSAGPVHAWTTDPAVNLLVSNFDPSFDAAVVSDGAGGAIIAWSNGNFPSDLYVQHVLASGAVDPAWPAGGRALFAGPGNQSSPVGIPDGGGGAIFAWEDSGNLGDIYAQHVQAGGALDPSWPANGRALCINGSPQHLPAITSDGNNGAIVTWTDERGSLVSDIYAQRVLLDGTVAWTLNGVPVCTTSDTQLSPDIAADGVGGAIISWRDSRGIYAQRVLSSGSLDPSWPAGGLALSTFGSVSDAPKMVSDGLDGAIVAWGDSRNETGSPNFDIFAQHVLPNGTVDGAWPVNGLPVCTALDVQQRPVIVSDGANGAIIAWKDLHYSAGGMIVAQRVRVSGSIDPAWPVNGRPLCSALQNKGYPSLVSDGAGGAIATWKDERSSEYDIYAQRILATGVVDPSWPANARAVCTAPGAQGPPALASDGMGGAIIAWADPRNGSDNDLYAQRVTRAGVLGADYVDAGAGLPGLFRSALAWGDYDNDGDLDLVLSGTDGGASRTYLLRNDAGTFVDAGAGLPGLEWCSLAWGDMDGDGDLDLALAGYSNGPSITRIYRNSGGSFVDLGASLPGLFAGSVTWADYDNDGDLDLLALGEDASLLAAAHLYRNDQAVFTEVPTSITGVYFSDAAWGDYDTDGDLDLVVAGWTGSAGSTKLYRNNGGVLVDSNAGLAGVWEGDVAWGDYDGDGDLDLLLAGWDGNVRHCDVIHNLGGTLLDFGSNPAGLSSSAVAWGDEDSDGDLDIFSTGHWAGGEGISRVYRDYGGTFLDAGTDLIGLYYSAVGVGDYDNDGDLDLAMSGISNNSGLISRIYRFGGTGWNAPPTAPTNLFSFRSGNQVYFFWSPGTDDHTWSPSYNLRVRTSPGGVEVMPAMAAASGFRKVPRLGNVQLRTSWTLTLPPNIAYQWAVQSIDGAYLGSPFANGPVVVGVGDDSPSAAIGLSAPGPNPFQSSTQLWLALNARTGVDVGVFDASGRRVRTLAMGERSAGQHSVRWDGCDDSGGRVAAGLYLIRAKTADGREDNRKVVLAR